MKSIKIDEFKNFKFLGNLHLSKDEKNLFYTVSNMNLEKNSYEHRIYKMDLETKKSFIFTNGAKESSFIELSDGSILFASDRENKKDDSDKTKFYKICPYGGEAILDFTIPAVVNSIKQINDEEFLILANFNRTKELEKIEKESKKEEKNNEKLYDDSKDYLVATEIPFWSNGAGFTNEDRSRLYYFNKKTSNLTPITDDITDIFGLELNKDKTKAVFIATTFTGRMPLVNEVKILDIKTKNIEILAKDYSFSYVNFIDSENIITIATDMKKYGLNENSNIYIINIKEKSFEKIVKDNFDMCMYNSVGTDVRLTGGKSILVKDGFMYFINTEVNSSYIYKIDKEGTLQRLNEKSGSIDCIDISNDGKIYAIALKDSNLQDIYEIRKNEENRISFHNDTKEYSISDVEEINFTNDGIGFIGYVMKPINYDPSKKYPGILHVHGGPKTVFGKVFHHEMQFLANNGYFVFFTNPRGSDGRGKEFADIRGKYGEIDFDDLMKFTDSVIKNYPSLDEERIAIMGGSYGGFMTNWAIGHTNRFKAACSQRSIANMTTEFLLTDIGYYFIDDQISATPWNNYEKLWYHSPLKYANKVKTPTLFIHSDEDYRCWIPEGIQMFSALKYHGVPAKLVMFKRENHELSRSGKPMHRIRRLKEIFDWFEEYLK